MKEFFKKNFAIVLAFALPVVFIAVIALSAYLPSIFLSTNYNFVYTSCTDGVDYYPYYCSDYLQKRYSVVNGKFVVNSMDFDGNYTARVFLHDTKNNESREITLEEAQTLSLNGLLTSPDGVTVSSNYDSGTDLLFFDSGSSYGYYLTKGSSRSKLNLINNGDGYYQDNVQFIGWVLPGRD
ncbi:hypothetical protein IPG41_04295 [Candidatus Peregrinibacteria bacterium]|nr:MAG: hypothetical protein IPG41_04295 [Candidatus Peregrinibacteria bacterium]